MNTYRVALLLWTVATCAGEDDLLLEPPNETGFQKCRDALKLPVLEVLPGGGWDNLRNIDMGRVMELTYTHCRTTEDGQYIIPNEVFTIPQKQSNLEMNSEILDSWMDYKSSTSSSINLDISVHSIVNGKFSAEFQRMKTLQVKDQSVTTRVQVRNVIYTVKINPASELSWEFRKELMDISDRLENNQTRMATYLAELLVLNYGTHIITSVDAGAALIQEDHIKSSALQDSQRNAKSVTASAGAVFSKIVNAKVDIGYSTEDSLIKGYLSNRTNSRVLSLGGIPFHPGITLEVWQQGINNHLVAMDRTGLPLHFFIKPNLLPELPRPLVKQVSQTVEDAVRRYYDFNTYPGCTDASSPNFNFQANMDDGSCNGKTHNISFGGIYQECTQNTGKDLALCPKLQQKNPLTGTFSCPSGYTPIRLLSQTHEEGYNHLECKKKCTLHIFCKTVCEDVFQVARAEFRAFWCAAKGQAPGHSGLLFGGLYSSRSINPVTNQQSCPASYTTLNLFENLKVCVTQDYELGYKFSVPFGGFFSCTAGNPLVNAALSGDHQKKCPGGFSQHLALITDGCQVSYCVKAGAFTGWSLPSARLPPFTRPPIMSQAATNTVIVTNSEGSSSWIRDSRTHRWRLGEPQELRRTMRIMNGENGGLSGGAAVGVSVAVTSLLAGLVLLAFYGIRKYKSKGYQPIDGEQKNVFVETGTGNIPELQPQRFPA
nr:macrophage-expressed gene 1 protein [Cavia porcellus]